MQAIRDLPGQNAWSGVFFLDDETNEENNGNGTVYGSSVMPSSDFSVPEDTTLFVSDGKTLDLTHVQVTNNGIVDATGGNLIGRNNIIGGIVLPEETTPPEEETPAAELSDLEKAVSVYEQLKEQGAFSSEDMTYLEKLIELAPWDASADDQSKVDSYAEMLLQEIYDRASIEADDSYLPSTPISDGFHTYSIGTMYYKDGKRVRGWADIDGARYYFDEKGLMATGWKEIEPESGYWYHFGTDGALDYGWYKEGNVWYYLDPVTGLMYNDGLAAIDKSTYYFYDWGGMASDWWYEAEDGWYFFGGSGAMKAAQWLEWKGDWYYLTETGRMATDTTIGEYYVNADGVWVK